MKETIGGIQIIRERILMPPAAAEAEARLIRKGLGETGVNKSKAALRLKVSCKTLLTKIKDDGIE